MTNFTQERVNSETDRDMRLFVRRKIAREGVDLAEWKGYDGAGLLEELLAENGLQAHEVAARLLPDGAVGLVAPEAPIPLGPGPDLEARTREARRHLDGIACDILREMMIGAEEDRGPPAWAIVATDPCLRVLARYQIDPVDLLADRSGYGVLLAEERELHGDVYELTTISHDAPGRLCCQHFVVDRDLGEITHYEEATGVRLRVARELQPDTVLNGWTGSSLARTVGLEEWHPLHGVNADIGESGLRNYAERGQPRGTEFVLHLRTRTLAAIPLAAMAAIGYHRPQVDPYEKPWHAGGPRLRALRAAP